METSLYQETDPDKTQELKKSMFLDFGSGNTKQQKFANLLASPDFNMLKLASPELEKMLLAQNGLMANTPTPTQFVYPKFVTDEQEAYARGFVEALAQLHGTVSGAPAISGANSAQDSKFGSQEDTAPTYSTLMPMSTPTVSSFSVSSAASTLANMGALNTNPLQRRQHTYVPSALAAPSRPPTSTIPQTENTGFVPQMDVKEEPSASGSSFNDHIVPSGSQISPTPSRSSRVTDSPAMSPQSNLGMDDYPIDMDDQEKVKLERKRARNRIAARKCRTRKLERISRLEEKVNDLKNKNHELATHAASLNEQVIQLKQQIMDHMKTGCQIMMPNVQNL